MSVVIKIFRYIRSAPLLLGLVVVWSFSSEAQISTTTTATRNILCVSSSVQLTTVPSGGTNYTYSWTPAGSLSNASIANPVATPTTTTTYFVTITDIPTSNTITDSVTILVQNTPPPVAVFPQADTICLGDTIQLDIVNDPLCQANPGTCQTPSSNATLGSGLTLAFTAEDNPFFKANNFVQQVRSTKHQYIYTADELNNLGIEGPTNISGIAWDVLVSFGTFTYTNLIMKMGCTSDTIATNTYKTGLSTVYVASSRSFSSTQFEQFNFTQPFTWDGTSSIVLEFCFVNAAASNSMPFVRFTQESTGVATFSAANSNVCGNTTGTVSLRRPNTRFFFCDLVHSSTLSYSWTPAAGLSSTTIKDPLANPIVTTSYIVTATDTAGCFKIDTAEISVAPSFNLSTMADTSLCQMDTLPISASHNGGGGAMVNWKASSFIQDNTLLNTNAFIQSNDKFKIEVTSALGCTKEDSFFVNLIPPVQVDILTSDTTICAGDTIPIKVSTNAQNCNTYSNIACQNPSYLTFSGTSTFPSGGITVSPYDASGTTSGQKKQYIFQASEFAALTNSKTINSLGFNVQSNSWSNSNRASFTIRMGCTDSTSFPFGASNFLTGLQTVYTPKNISVGTGWNDYTFDNAFVWDGTSNVVVEICWDANANLGFGVTTMNWTNTSQTSVNVLWNSTNYCSQPQGGFATSIRPEMRFQHCSSPPNPAYDFQWTPAGGLSLDTIPEPLANPTTPTNFVLTVTDPLTGCSDDDTIAINTAPDFNTTVTADSVLCAEDTVQLNVSHTSTSPVTYYWSPINLVSDTSIANPLLYVDDSKTVVSRVSSSLGCIKWDTLNFGVSDQLDLNIILPATKSCENDSVQLDTEVSLSCGLSTSAQCASTNTLTVGNSTASTALFNVTPFVGSNTSSKKQYLIRKSELIAAGMTTSSQLSSISFEIASLGKADYENFRIKMGCTSVSAYNNSFISGGETVYEPKNVTLVAGKNWFDFDKRFNWDGQSNIFVEICYDNSATGSNSDVFYTLPNPNYNCTFYRRGTNICNSGTGTAYSRRPNIEFKYCSVTNTSYLYSWSPPNLFNDPGLPNPQALVTQPGTYTLSVTDQSTGCVFTDSVDLEVLSFDVEALKDTSLCSTEDYQLDVNTNAVSPKFKWSPANELSNDTIPDPVILVDNGTSYIVEVTDSGGCVKSDTVVITLLPQPNANASPGTITLCRDEEFQLNATGGGTFEWSPASAVSNPTAQNPKGHMSDSGVIYLEVTNSFGCTDEDSVIVNIYPSPILELGPDTAYCTGTTIELDAGSGFLSYLWQDNSKQPTYLVESDGKYWVRVDDNFGCVFSDTILIDEAPAPVGDLAYTTELCEGDSVILDAANPGASYTWSTGESSQRIIVKEGGSFWVEIDDGDCIGLDSTVVKVYEYPVSELTEISYYCEKELPFGLSLQAGPDDYSYKWSTGHVTNSIVVKDPGNYTVEITNGGKCTVVSSTEVRLLCREYIYVPNTFTPNNDWKNDKFTIIASNLDEFEFRIFNRWGEVIFYSSSPDFEWDGTLDGKDVPNGVYVWRIDYKIRQADGSFESKEAKGTVNVLR